MYNIKLNIEYNRVFTILFLYIYCTLKTCLSVSLSLSLSTLLSTTHRLGYESECGESFNPTSTSQENVKAFFNCVQKFQKDSEIPPLHQDGVLCEATLKKIRQTVRTIRRTL